MNYKNLKGTEWLKYEAVGQTTEYEIETYLFHFEDRIIVVLTLRDIVCLRLCTSS
jgi:hypothetical protein